MVNYRLLLTKNTRQCGWTIATGDIAKHITAMTVHQQTGGKIAGAISTAKLTSADSN